MEGMREEWDSRDEWKQGRVIVKKKVRDGRVEEEDKTKKRKIWSTREKGGG